MVLGASAPYTTWEDTTMDLNLPEGFILKEKHEKTLQELIDKYSLSEECLNDLVSFHCEIMEDFEKDLKEAS